jgi:ribonuclease G
MPNELIINLTEQDTRVALLEHGVVAEFHIEPARKVDVVGNIYKGRVLRVLPGMQAAFVDIGLDRAAFLYVADIVGHYDDCRMIIATSPENGAKNGVFASAQNLDYDKDSLKEPIQTIPIEKLLKDGQELLVQVAKEPLGSKGARITNHISLPGRHLVLMPTMAHVGISRRIEDEKERNRLREIVEEIRDGSEMGCIVRTVAEEMDVETLKTDWDFLAHLWEQLRAKSVNASSPSLIHSDLSMTLRAIRDILTDDIDRVLIDNKDEYEKIFSFFGDNMPGLNTTVELYEDDEPVFEKFGLEIEIARAMQGKVWLRSGGYIIIEHTEALTAIDVNTGRYVGRRDFEETILNTNLEAVKEICHQLRLRNIGGIIIIDFIDMEKEGNREKVYNSLVTKLENDKARTNVLAFSELGLVEMTRKRTRENIMRVMTESCPYCEGRGVVKSRTAVCAQIFRRLRKEAPNIDTPTIILHVNPDVADLFYEQERQPLENLEIQLKKRIVIKDIVSFHVEQFEIAGA